MGRRRGTPGRPTEARQLQAVADTTDGGVCGGGGTRAAAEGGGAADAGIVGTTGKNVGEPPPAVALAADAPAAPGRQCPV